MLFAMLPACGSDATGQPCGGFIQNAPTCPSGYTCAPLPDSGPDDRGVCEKNH